MWQAVIAFQDYPFKTATGLPFRYKLKVGKNGEYNRELLIDRREKSKSLAWSSVVLAFENGKRISEEVKKPKTLGDIRGELSINSYNENVERRNDEKFEYLSKWIECERENLKKEEMMKTF